MEPRTPPAAPALSTVPPTLPGGPCEKHPAFGHPEGKTDDEHGRRGPEGV